MADIKSSPSSRTEQKSRMSTSPPSKSPNPDLSQPQCPSHLHTNPDFPKYLSFYNIHSYAGTQLPDGNPIKTGIWSNATRTPNHYVSSNGKIFHDPPPSLYRFQTPADIPEANMIQEALSYTWKDFDAWVGWKVPRVMEVKEFQGDRMKSYHAQWDFIQYLLVEFWKGPKNLAPRLVSVGPWKRGIWDFTEPKFEVEALWWGYDRTRLEEEQFRVLMLGDRNEDEEGNGSRGQEQQEERGNENRDQDRGQEEQKERMVLKPTASTADLNRAWNELHRWTPFGDDRLEPAGREEMDGW